MRNWGRGWGLRSWLPVAALLWGAMLAGLAFPALAQSEGVGPIMPHRIYDLRTSQEISFEQLLDRLEGARVVVFGEEHDSRQGHLFELALLKGLHRRIGDGLVLSMEMLERDDRSTLSAYLAGLISELEFRDAARLWPNWLEDYRPMAEYARTHGLDVVAANAPRPLASRASREGIDHLLASLSETERSYLFRPAKLDKGEYWQRFKAVMSQGHPGAENASEELIWRFFQSQKVKDATMAVSVLEALGRRGVRQVYHITGSFHSDYHLGMVEEIWARQPDLPLLTLTMVRDPGLRADPAEFEGRADFLVVVLPNEKGKD